MRWAKVGIVVALIAGACSSSDGGSETAESGTQTVETGSRPTVETSSPTVETSSPTTGDVVESGPILSVVTAHDVDEVGVPLEPALEFAPDVAQISVLVRVGEVEPGVPLEVAWTWLDGPDGEQPLFEHQIDVAAGDVAYSHGVASGPLAAGRYRATRDARRVDRPKRCSQCATRRSCFPRGCRGSPDERRTPRSPCRLRAARAARSPHRTRPPAPAVSRTSKSSCCWRSPAPTDATTTSSKSPHGSATTRPASTVAGSATSSNRSKPTPAISAVPTSPPTRSNTRSPSSPDDEVGSPDPSDRSRPRARHAPPRWRSSPANRCRARRSTSATRSSSRSRLTTASSVDSVISGIASVTLATDGHEVDGLEFTGPVACDKSRIRRVVQLEYVVPENPPELVTLVATVRDYEGHETTVEASYPTVSLWTGYMDVVGSSVTEITIDARSCSVHVRLGVQGRVLRAVSGRAVRLCRRDRNGAFRVRRTVRTTGPAGHAPRHLGDDDT